jgi:predicted DNA-binding transcriptional regulator AlpA
MTHTDQFISVKQVSNILGIGVSTAWLWYSKPAFPKAIKLSERYTRWSLREVTSFANDLKAARHYSTAIPTCG